MALVVNLKTVEYLKGKYDRVVRITFRGKTLQSNIVHNAKRVAYFGQSFEWPIARTMEATDSLELLVFNYSKYLSDKLVGSYVMFLQQVMETGQLSLSENLVDKNNKIIPETITFDVAYISPGGDVGNWSHRMTQQYNPTSGDEVEEDDAMLEEERAKVEELKKLEEEREKDDEDGESSEMASVNLVMDNMSIDRNTRPTYVDMQLDRPREFEVMVTILEGQQLPGLDIDPVIKVEVGEQSKYTSIRLSSNSPYYNEYFVFNFNEMPAIFFDKLLTITAYHAYGIPGRHVLRSGNMVAAKRLIGSFRCDLGMVYMAPDHQFYHKWAVLMDPRDLDAGSKGYIKCDIAITGRGQAIRVPTNALNTDDKDSIEANLLLPQGIKSTRHRAVYTINIYKAEELPQTDIGIIASMQRVLTNKDVAFIDALVKVSFVGQVGKTSSIKSYYPEWNESLKFMDMFPPLCNRIKIQLCDQDGLSTEPVATHFIELSQIMDPGSSNDGILPTFGPSWLNMYGTTRAFKMMKDGTEDLNEGFGEGSSFRGRVLLSLRTSVDPTEMAIEGSSKVIKEKLRTGLSEHAAKKPFLLFATIFEASMIDAKLDKKAVQFEISIGKFGNVLDGSSTAKNPFPDVLGEGEDENEDDGSVAGVPSLKQQLLRRQKNEENYLPCHSMTPKKIIQLANKNYGYLPMHEEKPCLYVVSLFEDIRKRHFHSNLVGRIAENLEDGLNDVKERLNRSDPDAHRRFKGVMEKLRSDCSIYLGTCLNIGAGSGKTKLDQYRIKACKKYMEILRKKAELFKSTTKADNLKTKMSLMREEPYKLKNFAKEPQHALPDVIIWMLCDDERVAYHRIPAKDLIFNPEPYMVGKHCGKRQTIFLKKPSKRSYGQSGWTVQAKLNMFIWLGVYEMSVKRYMDDLPEGYELLHKGDNAALPPMALIYSEHHSYQLRAYMFQARSLIPSDDTGLSDPFARVIFGSQCATTQVIHESLSPTWDETLIMDNIILFGDPEDIKASPPLVIIEIYDHDTLGQPEYLGRVIASPKFNLSQEEYIPPKLEWWDIFRGPHKSGQLLASFEFIEGEEKKLPPRPPMKEAKGKVLMNKEKKPLYSVPPYIKPVTAKHRLEILFRGVRDLKKIQLLTVDHPYVIVECSGQTKQSDRILNIDKSNNFESFLHYIDLDLPEEKIFWPPLTIRCMETRSFGRTLLVGIHTIVNVEEFIYKENRCFIAPTGSQPIEGEDGVDSLGNGQPGTSVAGDVQSQHTAVSSKTTKTTKTAKSGASKQQLEQQQETRSNVLSGALSWATRITHKTATTVLSETISGFKSGDVTDLLDAGIGLATDKPPTADEPAISSTTSNSQPHKGQKKEKELTPEEMDVQRAIHKNMIAELDWWSKYYVSKDDAAREQRLRDKNKNNLNPDAASDDFGLSIPDYSAIDMDGFGRHVEDLKKQAIEAEKLKMKKKRKKRFFTRRKMKKKMSKLKGRLNEAFSRDTPGADEGEDDGEESPLEDNSYIQRLQCYTCGLEELSEFNQFSKFFRTFQLYRGKKSTDEAEDFERFSGLFKGQFCIYKLEDEDKNGLNSTDDNGNKEPAEQVQPTQQQIQPAQQQPVLPSDDKKSALPNDIDVSQFKLARYLPTNKPVDVKVLIYILKGVDLHPMDMDGRVDSYLILKCGKNVIDDKSNKIDNTLNPLYGRLYEFDAKFPLDSILKIEVWDYDSMSSDDKVGETSIDLEDRYFTHHLARCAIQQKYETFGYNTWRNPLKPSELLEKFCLDYGYPKPVYTSGSVWIGKGGIIRFYAESDEEKYEENENGDLRPTTEHLALKALRSWHTIPGGWPLVPEHVESRPLYCGDRPGLIQGHLEMWIDMFPKDCPKLPATIDVSPRIPKSYELRCIIWNTDEVTLDDVNFLTGEASSDIFVKGFIKGVGVDDMKTDIHYRSLTGEGNFNWRFIFKFDYLKAENKVVYKKKDHVLASDEVEHKSPPHLSIQVWDADLVTADDFLGSITLDLLKIPRPVKHVKKCSLKMIEDSNYPTLNLFKNKRCKGWLPVAAIEKPESKDDYNYDDDDSIGDDNEEQEKLMIKGKVEIELELLTQEEAEKIPVGIGHEEPEAMPKPNRPDTSFLWFMNPLKTLKYIIWKNYKWLLLKLLLLALLIMFLVLFFYNFPGAFVNKILNV